MLASSEKLFHDTGTPEMFQYLGPKLYLVTFFVLGELFEKAKHEMQMHKPDLSNREADCPNFIKVSSDTEQSYMEDTLWSVTWTKSEIPSNAVPTSPEGALMIFGIINNDISKKKYLKI